MPNGVLLPAGPLGPALTFGKTGFQSPELWRAYRLHQKGANQESLMPTYTPATDMCSFGSMLFDVMHAKTGKQLRHVGGGEYKDRIGTDFTELVTEVFEELPGEIRKGTCS